MLEDQPRDDAFRAIGRYVVEFSNLIREMRELVCEYVAKGVPDAYLPNMLLGEAMPSAIANAFFGVCRLAADYDDDEAKIAGKFRQEVTKAIETRNDISHGDWFIGLIQLREREAEGVRVQVMNPRLVRTIPARSEGPRKVVDLSTNDIDKLSNRIVEVLPFIEEFGKLALGLPMLEAFDDGSSPVIKGKYRIRDVFTARRERRDSPLVVARDGPHAERVLAAFYPEVEYSSTIRLSASE